MLRKLLTRGLPAPPDETPGPRTLIAQALDVRPLAPLRAFWEGLNAMRPWWPVLLPLLAWIGWRTYQRERTELLSRHKT
jgi:hypothetical protein